MENNNDKVLIPAEETKKLLEKSRLLKEKAKTTIEKLSELQELGKKFKGGQAEPMD